MRVIHVLRKPLSEGTVASNVLKHGCGGLNIDASRIGSDSTRRPTGTKMFGKGTGWNEHNMKDIMGGSDSGRWPANVILQHLDGCRCDGVKKIRSSSGSPQTQEAYPKAAKGITLEGSADAALNQHRSSGYRNPDGKETVANWICEPGCPVQEMDEQSGVLAPQGGQKHKDKDTKEGSFLDTGFGGSPTSSFYGDKGGASRFFKQIGGKTDEAD